MQSPALPQREFQAVHIQVGIGRRRIAAAVTEVDLLLRVEREEVDRVVPVAVEQADIDIVHARDAQAHVAAELLAQR